MDSSSKNDKAMKQTSDNCMSREESHNRVRRYIKEETAD